LVDTVTSVTILIPALNEAVALPETLANLANLLPPPDEILLVDGGSDDETCAIAALAGIKVTVSPVQGRGAQINHGVAAASGEIICVFHADSRLPVDAVAVIRTSMANPKTVLASFTPRIAGPNGTRWGTTAHNWIKTWYAPLLFRPHLFLGGVRLLFGDHAMFFRRAQFLEVGGCDPEARIMEEADLCIKLAPLGKIRLIPRWVWTSDRRIAAWGPIKANWTYLKVGALWAIGARSRLAEHYPDVR
jgi:glycosyltransferase involved in cell wall biosynthesis